MAVEFVVGHPYADIGKGWVTASRATHLRNPLIIKIDPALNLEIPSTVGLLLEGKRVTPDVVVYMRRGHQFIPEQNILMGSFLARTQQGNPSSEGVLAQDIAPALSMTDVSIKLARYIDALMQRAHTEEAVIEVGGSSDDPETKPIPGAARLLTQKYGGGVVLVTKFDTSEEDGKSSIRTRVPVRAIETTMREYWGVPLSTVFVRRDKVTTDFTDDELKAACKIVAFKTQQHPEEVVLLPNVATPEELDTFTAPRNRAQGVA